MNHKGRIASAYKRTMPIKRIEPGLYVTGYGPAADTIGVTSLTNPRRLTADDPILNHLLGIFVWKIGPTLCHPLSCYSSNGTFQSADLTRDRTLDYLLQRTYADGRPYKHTFFEITED